VSLLILLVFSYCIMFVLLLSFTLSRPFSTAAYTGMRNCLFAVVHIVWLVTLRLHLVATCSGRSVLNATTGVITDGTGNYPVSASCEWLIDGKWNVFFVSCSFHSLSWSVGWSITILATGDVCETKPTNWYWWLVLVRNLQ